MAKPSWELILDQAFTLAKQAAQPATCLRHTCRKFPSVQHQIFYEPTADDIHVSLDPETTSKVASAWEQGLANLGCNSVAGAPWDVPPDGYLTRPWVMVKCSFDPSIVPTVSKVSPLAIWKESSTRIACSLASGLLNKYAGWPFQPCDRSEQFTKAAMALELLFPDLDPDQFFYKRAFQSSNFGLDLTQKMPTIDRDSFGQTIWQDPYMTTPLKDATLGLLTAASRVNGNTPFLDPFSIAHVSPNPHQGFFAGQTMAAMSDVSPATRQNLQDSGMWSRIITAVIPPAFQPSDRIYHF